MSVVSIKKSLVCWKDITRNFEFENEEEKNSGKEGEGQNNNLILKKQLQNTNIISIRKVYLMVWCIELNWKSDQLRIKIYVSDYRLARRKEVCGEGAVFL